ncbi:DegT/DnrJ/EryC1/StrS family aminotransferase [Candidatus Curtissbacteria bacterium]|nr:DegT/DnrJ/EryC1/StrS family aminotransferase [Candidatus Curtissbacteria bacterium]
MIPLTDIALEPDLYREIKKNINKVIDSKNYILGHELEKFEKTFAKFIGAKEAVGVGSGTDALRLALRANGISAGDKVLTVSLTSPFTSVAIMEEGAIPVFCDVDEKTWTMDVHDSAVRIDKKVKAIMPVHIYGNPADMKTILKFAKTYKLAVIEDACQAHGAAIKGTKVGNFSDAAAFSFYPTKNLGGLGDGGMVTTNSRKVAKMIKMLRHGGQAKRFWHAYRGINSRLDEIQAAILSAKIKRLNKHNLLRTTIAKRYQRALGNLPLEFQDTVEGGVSVNHLFVIRTKQRPQLYTFLKSKNITTDVYYPTPVHEQPIFKKFAQSALPVTEKLSKELLALPIFPKLKTSHQEYVISMIHKFYDTHRKSI